MNLIVQLFCVGDDMWLSSRVAVLKVCTISRPSNQMVYYVIVEPHQVFSYRHRSVCDSCCTSLPFIYIIKVVVTFFFFFHVSVSITNWRSNLTATNLWTFILNS